MQSGLDDDLLSDGASYKLGVFNFSKAQESPYWNIFFLAIAWALTLTTSTLLTTIGPLTAKDLGASSSISAFTVGCFLIGAAVSSVPSGTIFRKYGRLVGFSIGCVFQIVGSVLGGLAILGGQLWLLFFGCFSIGLGQGLGQFYRFSAVEVSPDYLKSRAVTYVLSGGILAAFLGPTCANYSSSLLEQDYLASFALIAGIGVLNQLTVLCVNFPPPIIHKHITSADLSNTLVASALHEDGVRISEHSDTRLPNVAESSNATHRDSMRIRTAKEIVTQPMFIVACTVATLAHTIMVMVMSNVSLAMDHSGFSFGNTSLTLEVHFLAMFSPGFFTGSLIERYGTFSVAFLGAVVFALSSFVLAAGDEFWNYALGMVLSGLGWNFAFSAGTVMLTCCYKPIEAAEVQAWNDFIIFSIAGAGSLISGVIYATWGWLFLIYIVSGLMAVYLALFAVMWKYAPADEEEEDEEVQQEGGWCPLLSGSETSAQAGAGAEGGSTISEDPEFGGVMSSQRTASSAGVGPHHGAAGKRGYSFDTRPAVGGALGIPVRGYDINSRNSSFASIHSNSSRKNSIAEVGIRISFA